MPSPVARHQVNPRTVLEQSLALLWADVLGLEQVGIDDNFFDLGGHSLLASELFARVEAAYGVRLPLSSLFPDATIERLADLLGQASQPENHSAIVPIQPHGRGAPFFCVHAIDGDVLRFEPLSRELGNQQPFFGLRAPGLANGEEPMDDIVAIAARYVDELFHAGFAEPFHLGGFSSGATIAFEMARQLRERGHSVGTLALFDGTAPLRRRQATERAWRSVQHLPVDLQAYLADMLRPERRRTVLQSKARDLPRWVGRRLDGTPEDWSTLEAVAGFSERHLAVALALGRAVRRYTPRPYDGRLTLFRARVRLLFSAHDRALGWDALARGGLDVQPAGGEHAELLREPYVREVADKLRDCLMRAEARKTPAAAWIPFGEDEVEQSIAARFEQQVAKFPDRLAIKSEQHQLTYAALNRLSNRIAHAILATNHARGQQIALLFGQQAPMIAASLAALKAGRLYVSLDPAYPRTRKQFILDDAEVGLILTDADLRPEAEDLANGRVVLDVSTLAPDLPDDNPGLAIPADALAYMMYTSGSTGQPKGVVENQRNVLHFTLNNSNNWQVCADDRISLLVPYWFSASATPTFAALLNGAALLPMNVKERGLLGLGQWLSQERISILHTSASILRHFLRALPDGRVIPGVRMIYTGSEPLFRSDVELYRRHFAETCVMMNALGATEMKQFSVLSITNQTEITEPVVPVGYPLPGVDYFLVDEAHQPAERGSVGEIVVRSRYIAPCYWRRPDLSAQAFRTDPSDPRLRLYYTGDLGRIDARGVLHHVGRKDFQVKVRGYRVELGEVTAALLEVPEIAEALVVAQQTETAAARLLAYVVARGEPAPSAASIRATLAARLPEYMAPSAFVFLDALPRNANGKVDHAALPLP